MKKNLKTSVTVFMLLVLTMALHAQTDVTQFLGIPVNGSKSEMIEKLKSKGFKITPENKDILVGEFNGTNVNIHIATNNNKVCRIMINDVHPISEIDIKIRFNKLCQQFQNNRRYLSTSILSSDFTISDDEDISYELTVNNKRYEAVYYQLPTNLDSAATVEELKTFLLTKYSEDQLSSPKEELQKEILETGLSYFMDKYSKKVVWFMINEYLGEYYITMYYDNEYNRANGDEL
ncbi:MAG: hypothetical protein IPH88_18650 [Bacteroidales bacterium]|nr:hypothetical protein [Bacteroidales bacterium]